jgi:hypothetical protein
MNTEAKETVVDGEEDLSLSLRADPVQLQLAEHVRRTWWHQPSIARTMEELMVPAYWTRCVTRLSAGGSDQPPDRIECMPSDRRWFLELMVLETGPEGAIVMKVAGGELPRYALPSRRPQLGTDDFEFHKSEEFVGKWAVVRKSDGLVMTRGQPLSRDQCAEWLAKYLRMVGNT